MKPAPPSAPAMYGRRTNEGTLESAGAQKIKFITDAEQQWYAMMASKSQSDEAWAAQEKPSKPKVIASPHTATHFRTPGSKVSPLLGRGGVARPMPSSSNVTSIAPLGASSAVLRVGRAPPGREVNSKTDAKPVPGQVFPLSMVKKPGAKPPPPMHPSLMMRKTNGMPPTSGSRPPPPNVRRIGHAPRGPRGAPPPDVLAKLRARGPPGPKPASRFYLRGPPSQVNTAYQEPPRNSHGPPPRGVQGLPPRGTQGQHLPKNTQRPNKLAQGGRNILSSQPLPSAVSETVSVEETVSTNDVDNSTIVSDQGEWIQLWDEEVESNYYYNQQTGEASWIKPDEVIEDLGDDSVVSSIGHSIDDEGWDRYWDDEAGAHYLHNPATGETKWETEYQGDNEGILEGDSLDRVAEGK